MNKRGLIYNIVVALFFFFFSTGISFAENVKYIDATGSENTANATSVTSSTTSLSGNWWVVNDNITINDPVSLNDDVNLILADGKELILNNVLAGESYNLTIYGQSGQSGKLTVTHTDNTIYVKNYHQYGGIVDVQSTNSDGLVAVQSFVMDGGKLTVDACFDECICAYNSSLTINNGEVTVKGSTNYNGIRCDAEDEDLTINGGIVRAEGSFSQSALAANKNVNINGGKVFAYNTGNAILAGIHSDHGTVNLGWTNNNDYIFSNYYYPEDIVNLNDNFYAGTSLLTSGKVDVNSTLNGLILSPNEALELTEKDGVSTLNSDTYKGNTLSVFFTRLGLVADTYSTICLPFSSFEPSGCTFYDYQGVSYSETEEKWICTVTPVDTPMLSADHPYIFKSNATSVTFQGIIGSVTGNYTDTNANTEVRGWRFQGTYSNINLPNKGEHDYGFSTSRDGSDIEAGTFVRLATGATAASFRAYLVYLGSSNLHNVPAFAPNADTLPASIVVRIVNGDTSAINDAKTNCADNTWYTIHGQRLPGQPVNNGIYIHNGHKIVIHNGK